MKNGIEIRWHGRGGQGAKTAALLLADVAFKTGQNVQGFPAVSYTHLAELTASSAVILSFV